MKAIEAIAQLRAVKENQYDDTELLRWLSDLDGQIYSEHIKPHEGTDDIAHGPHDQESVLMIPEPYTNVYITWLTAMVDYHNGELDRFNNSMVMYNMALMAFVNWFNRTNMPKQDFILRT